MLVAKKQLEYCYSEQIDVEKKRPRKVQKKKKNKSKNNSIVVFKLFVMGLAIIGLILCLFVLYRYANITEIRSEVTELEKQKTELKREKQDLIGELEGIKSSSKIEEDATIKLGMDFPTEDQIVYIDVEDLVLEDKANTKDEFAIVKQLKNIMNLVLGLF